ncbi:MAG: 4'-phosphopantetheinyl transferase superfamily protein [Gammaproteobacteria bacterium]|nr:4'-phosphopantetheinyl transferase superfamily protein [Gammaproteobacteria bacterium]
MIRDRSRQIDDLFTASSRDLTPVSVHHAAQVLYAPVSSDPMVTRCCSTVLLDTERWRADRFAIKSDKDSFIQRRAFRRFCGARALGTAQGLSQIIFSETDKGRPYLSSFPELWFSFSSCRFGFVGAWSSTHGVGVDIEDQTRELEPAKLAHQFFSGAETKAVEGYDGQTSHQAFFQLWSLKEAALKSIGEGLPFGLDAFKFELVPSLCVIQAPPAKGGSERFRAYMIEGTNSCAALVTRRVN